MKIYAALWPNNGSIPIKGEEIVVQSPDQLDDPNGILILWGGEDISPSLYNETPGKIGRAHV